MKVENSCTCQKCQNMCKTPCLGTPDDIYKIIKAGFEDKLTPILWGFGILAGTHNYPVPMVQAKVENGYCVFFKKGRCSLHDLDLKPTEGALPHCKEKTPTSKEELLETPIYKVVKEWELFNQKKIKNDRNRKKKPTRADGFISNNSIFWIYYSSNF